MKQRKHNSDNGLDLGNPNLIVSETSFLRRFFFHYFVLLLGISGAFGCFYTAFEIPVSLQIIAPCIILLTAVFTALFLLKRCGIWLSLLLVVGIGTSLLLRNNLMNGFMDNLIQGFIHTINYVILAYAGKSNYYLITWLTKPAGISEISVSCTVFAIFMLFLLTLFMAWLLIWRKKVFLCFLLTMPFLASALVFMIIPHFAAVTALLLFSTFLLLNTSFLRKNNGFVKRRNIFFSDGNAVIHPISLTLLPILAVSLLLLGVLFPKERFQRSDFNEDLRSGLMSMPSISSLFRVGGLAGNIRSVKLQLVGDLAFTGETVLRVKSSKLEADYLKGFVGSVYTGQSWESLPGEEYQEINAILAERKVQNFPYQFIDIFPSYLDADTYEYDLTVQNMKSNSRCIYVPYGMISGPEDLAGIDFVNDGFLISGNRFFGTKEYSIKATSFRTSERFSTFYDRFNWFFNQTFLVTADTNITLQGDIYDIARQTDEWIMPEHLVELLSPEQAAFSQDVQAYTRFVYSHYTQLPEGLEDKLDKYRLDHDLDTAHYPWPLLLADAIINQIHSENTYTLSPGVMPAGRDFVEYFLFENQRGYCMHFASATAALLRSAGVPARYAEGYAVSPSDFGSADEWANIPDSRAHAWVEIYLSGVGWVPVEATPGAQNGIVDPVAAAAATLDVSANIPEEAASPEPSEEPLAEADSEIVSSEPETPDVVDVEEASQNDLSKPLPPIIIVLMAIGLLLAVILINRKLRVIARNKQFMQQDYNKAAVAVYDYILKLLLYTKSALNLSSEVPEYLHELVLKARFSQHTLTKQELHMLLNYATKQTEHIREKAPLLRRLVGKYILALF